jgi:hypothetical protein
MAISFQPHGEFTARVEGRIIISEVVGPWNKELVDQWAAALHVVAKQLCATGPHVGIAVLHGSMMCPPDAFTAMRQAISYAAAKLDCIGNILVAEASVEGRALLLPVYAQLYGEGVPQRFFYDIDSAKAWALTLLAERGY